MTQTPKKRAPRQLPTDPIEPGNLQAELGRSLKIARLRQHLTLAEVAKATGSTVQHISRIEHGQGNPSLAILKRLLGAVGLQIVAVKQRR